MSALLCWFRQCRWQHLFDVMAKTGAQTMHDVLGQYPAQIGVYQCSRCKTISAGAPRH